MRRSSLLFVFVLCFHFFVQARHCDTVGLKNAAYQLNLALVRKDRKSIKKLLSQRIQYAHSNGWIETRKELIKHLFDGTLSYQSIQLEKVDVVINKNIGVVKSRGKYVVIMGQKLFEFKLVATQIWEWKRRRWKLMGRQSVQVIE